MNYILSISLRDEDTWIVKALAELPGSRSAHVVQAIKDYLVACGSEGAIAATQEKPPYWFVPGKDYSQLLPIDERRTLVKFGYTDEELRDEMATDSGLP